MASIPKRTSRKWPSLIGITFGRLTVDKATGESDRSGKRTWICHCSCGTEHIVVSTGALTSGNTTSCGCWKLEATGNAHRTHGMSRTAIYRVWCLMKFRCCDPTCEDYPSYGGRGIKVCDRWLHSFENFLTDVGPRPDKHSTLDRIDNERDYEPDNTRWTSRKDQCRNKRSNRVIEHNGEILPISVWAERAGISQALLSRRLSRGLSMDRALTAQDLRASTGAGAFMSSERGTWYAMRRRCNDPLDEAYPDYGGRGIQVCDRWQGPEGFANFLADMGLRPSGGYSLDRIDVNGPYSPANCQWCNAKAQARNTRRTRMLHFQGEDLCLAAWAERFGLPQWLISQRLQRGWTVERALTTPHNKLQ